MKEDYYILMFSRCYDYQCVVIDQGQSSSLCTCARVQSASVSSSKKENSLMRADLNRCPCSSSVVDFF